MTQRPVICMNDGIITLPIYVAQPCAVQGPDCWPYSQSKKMNVLVTQLYLIVWLLCPWDFSSKNTGVGYHFLLQGIFPTQGSRLGLPKDSVSEESACKEGDPALIPGLGRSPGEGNGNPLQCSCLRNPMGRGAWQATVHGVTKELDTTWPLHHHHHHPYHRH